MEKNNVILSLPANESRIQTDIFDSKNDNQKNESVPVAFSEPQNKYQLTPQIKVKAHRFPYCIVWTPISCITAIFPSIGHVGICESNGIIHDFAGSKYVSINQMAFGWPTKYVLLDIDSSDKTLWDRAIEKGDERYNAEDYSFFINNCHSYVAYVLNTYKYKEKCNYNMFIIWWILCTKSKYISWSALFKTYIWSILILVIIGVIIWLICFKTK